MCSVGIACVRDMKRDNGNARSVIVLLELTIIIGYIFPHEEKSCKSHEILFCSVTYSYLQIYIYICIFYIFIYYYKCETQYRNADCIFLITYVYTDDDKKSREIVSFLFFLKSDISRKIAFFHINNYLTTQNLPYLRGKKNRKKKETKFFILFDLKLR